MVDELAVWGHTCPVVVADAGYGDNSHFRAGLSARGIPWVMAVKAGNTAYPADAVPERLASTGPGHAKHSTLPAGPLHPGRPRGRRRPQATAPRHGANKTAAGAASPPALRAVENRGVAETLPTPRWARSDTSHNGSVFDRHDTRDARISQDRGEQEWARHSSGSGGGSLLRSSIVAHLNPKMLRLTLFYFGKLPDDARH